MPRERPNRRVKPGTNFTNWGIESSIETRKIKKLLLLGALLILTACAPIVPPPPTVAIPTETGFAVTIPQRGYMRSKTTISVEAVPGAVCELIFISSNGGHSNAEGLGLTTANEMGLCSWSFVIEEAERKYDARLLIYVDGVSETHFMEIRKGY